MQNFKNIFTLTESSTKNQVKATIICLERTKTLAIFRKMKQRNAPFLCEGCFEMDQTHWIHAV